MVIFKNLPLTFKKLMFFGALSLLVLLVSAFVIPTLSSAGADARPNIIIFLVDDTRLCGSWGLRFGDRNTESRRARGARHPVLELPHRRHLLTDSQHAAHRSG